MGGWEEKTRGLPFQPFSLFHPAHITHPPLPTHPPTHPLYLPSQDVLHQRPAHLVKHRLLIVIMGRTKHAVEPKRLGHALETWGGWVGGWVGGREVSSKRAGRWVGGWVGRWKASSKSLSSSFSLEACREGDGWVGG